MLFFPQGVNSIRTDSLLWPCRTGRHCKARRLTSVGPSTLEPSLIPSHLGECSHLSIRPHAHLAALPGPCLPILHSGRPRYASRADRVGCGSNPGSASCYHVNLDKLFYETHWFMKQKPVNQMVNRNNPHTMPIVIFKIFRIVSIPV